MSARQKGFDQTRKPQGLIVMQHVPGIFDHRGFHLGDAAQALVIFVQAELALPPLREAVVAGLDGEGGTQFGMTLQSGMAISSHSAILGGRDLEPSALVVEVKGDARNAEFDILIDDAVRGRVSPGQRFSMFVPGYRVYTVRLRPTTASSVSYDSAPRVVTLYPGNVQTLVWTAQSYFTMFAQAMAADGRPIANALVRAAKTVAETDADGYFQIDIGRNDPITITEKSGASCRLAAPKVVQPRNDFASVGKVLCQ